MFAEGAISAMLPVLAVVCAALSLILLAWYWIRRPPLHGAVKVVLFAAIGVFPIGAAGSVNVATLEYSKKRSFCGSCHVMLPYTNDSADPLSTTLASTHARNELFGSENCYTCHADYGMFGTVMTKAGGLRHVWEYYTKFKDFSIEEALPQIHLYKPLTNATCTHCHSMTAPYWVQVAEHRSLGDTLASGQVACASAGCHGPSHPFSKNLSDNHEPTGERP